MNIIDLILALGLFYLAWKGWQIGLVQSLIGLISVVLAYGCALAYGESLARALFDSTSEGAVLIGFFAVGLAVLISCYLIGQAIHRVLHASPLGLVDAVGGGILGLAQGVLIIGLLTLFLHANPIHSRVPELIDDSALGPPLQKAARVIADGVQAMFPNVKTTLEKLGIQTSSQVPPLIQKLNKEARDARDKINELIDAAQDSAVSPRPAARR